MIQFDLRIFFSKGWVKNTHQHDDPKVYKLDVASSWWSQAVQSPQHSRGEAIDMTNHGATEKVDDPSKKIPSWEQTYPLPAGTFESMIFLFPRRDMWSFPGGYINLPFVLGYTDLEWPNLIKSCHQNLGQQNEVDFLWNLSTCSNWLQQQLRCSKWCKQSTRSPSEAIHLQQDQAYFKPKTLTWPHQGGVMKQGHFSSTESEQKSWYSTAWSRKSQVPPPFCCWTWGEELDFLKQAKGRAAEFPTSKTKTFPNGHLSHRQN